MSPRLPHPVTCLDPRCVPENFFGPNFRGPVFRNAGGRATDDAIRSFAVLRGLADMKSVVVIHHTGTLPPPPPPSGPPSGPQLLHSYLLLGSRETDKLARLWHDACDRA